MLFRIHTARWAGLIPLLSLVLVISAVAPCSLIERAAASLCTEQPVGGPGANGEAAAGGHAEAEALQADAQLGHVDCCDGCLTCCVSYTEALALGPLARVGVSRLPRFFVEQRPLGSMLSIWRPPRR